MSTSSEPTFARTGAPAVERAAREFARALVEGDSALTPGQRIWTLENAQELLREFNGRPEVPGATFDEKLAHQLSGAGPGAVQLFAELYVLDLLPLADYKGATKRALVASTLALAGLDLALPPWIDSALDEGVLGGGVAFKTRRYWQLCYLIEFAAGFLAMAQPEREKALAHALAFRDTLDGLTTTNAPSQRATLLYLLFPEVFLPVAKTEHRTLMRTAFADRLDQPTGDPDLDLRAVYDALVAEAGRPVDLYQAPYREKWDAQALQSSTYEQTPWDAFMSWAARLAAAIDLHANERDYKVEMATALSEARSQVLEASTGWEDALRKALASGNLLSHYFLTPLGNVLTAESAGLRAVIERFWSSDVPDPSLLTRLLVDLKQLLPVSPGDATALGSVLLMARDAGQFPPYRPTPVDRARALTSSPTSGTTPSDRYDDLLALCDEVLDRAADAGIELQDRLDAQGLIWAVVTYDPPAGWSAGDRKAFLAWRGDAAGERAGTRAWLVRGNSVNGKDLVPHWLADGYVSLPATHLREVEPGIARDQLKVVVDDDYAHASYAAKAEKLDEFDFFLNRMQDDDVVVTVDQGRLHVGRLAGEPGFRTSAEQDSNLVREVAWAAGGGVGFDDLPDDLVARLKVQRDVLDLTQHLESLEGLLATEREQKAPPPVHEVVLPPATPRLAADLHVDQAWLQECIDLLNDRPQLIFYGPPGTGKTYIALALAQHVAGDNVRLVQFHPSYSYEDFFEGFRPTADGGFALRPGPLRKVVDQATANPSVPHVLIIDEINRGNLAKVFEELYFLLEYRTRSVELLYADEEFSLPRNVFLIGTMNTADRSIALVDSAMRRRFAFLPLHPSELPTSSVLRSWLRERGRDEVVADLLDELNTRIEDVDFRIGPSYVMRDAVFDEGGLERVWRTSILPLLEEHHYGDLTAVDVAARYGLGSIRTSVAARGAQPPEDGAAGAAPPAD